MFQKIHRRKNTEIAKQFVCPNGCGKAYGSYAALYTHIKNKHPSTKPPEMKEGTIKTKEPSKKQPKHEIPFESNEDRQDFDCKVCRQEHCICFQEIDHEEHERAIELFQDQGFVKFIDSVGQLSIGDKFSWTRGTEDDFDFLQKGRLREMASQFNQKYHSPSPVILTGKWLEYLSLSSRFWDTRYIGQLYSSIFLILSRPNQKELQQFINSNSEFENMKLCIANRGKEWTEFVNLIKIL